MDSCIPKEEEEEEEEEEEGFMHYIICNSCIT
jgi:hypothetical protein